MPKFIHDCSSCRYLGTFCDKYDLYVCHEDCKFPSYVIRYGNEDYEYISTYFQKEKIQETLNRISGISQSEAIILCMIQSSTSFILNEIKLI